MNLSVDCLPCLVNQAVKVAKTHLSSEKKQRALVLKVIKEIARIEEDTPAPYVAQRIQRALKEALQNPDPYREQKYYYSQEMLKIEDDLTNLVLSSSDQLHAAVKLAAAGNIIDFGPGYDLSKEKVLEIISETMRKDFDQEVFQALKQKLGRAKQLLFLGDNAGEIVFDKIFIRVIRALFPQLEVYFATRGAPVINDVIEEDAYFVGMDAYAKIINNGSDIPGTLLEDCSESFIKIFKASDIVIAKGMGNFESLYGTGHTHIFYIFLCKCSLFMQRFKAELNDIMLIRD